jgi:hypothetical protein
MYARCIGGGILIGLVFALLVGSIANNSEPAFSDYFYTALSFCVLFAGIGYLFYMTTRGILPSQRFLTRKMREKYDELQISDYAGTDKITKGLGILSIAALLIFIIGIGVLQRKEIMEAATKVMPANRVHMAFAVGIFVTTLSLHQLLVVFRIRKAEIYEPEGDEILVQLTRACTIALSVFAFLASLVFGFFFKPVTPTAQASFVSGLIAGILIMVGPTIMIVKTEHMKKDEVLSGMQTIVLGVVAPIVTVLTALYILYSSATGAH